MYVWIQLENVHVQMSLAETSVDQVTINSLKTDVSITIGPPCLFIQGATKVVIRDIAGVLKNLMYGVKGDNC